MTHLHLSIMEIYVGIRSCGRLFRRTKQDQFSSMAFSGAKEVIKKVAFRLMRIGHRATKWAALILSSPKWHLSCEWTLEALPEHQRWSSSSSSSSPNSLISPFLALELSGLHVFWGFCSHPVVFLTWKSNVELSFILTVHRPVTCAALSFPVRPGFVDTFCGRWAYL